MKKYQPERYEDWIAGRDVGPHPEDDQVWPTRRAVPVRGLSVQVDAAASSSASAPMASGSTCSSKSSSNLDAIFDQVVRDDVCDTDSSRKRHPPFSDFQKSDGFLQTQAKKIRTLSDSDSQSDSDSSDSDYLHSSDSSASDSSDAEQVQVSRKEGACFLHSTQDFCSKQRSPLFYFFRGPFAPWSVLGSMTNLITNFRSHQVKVFLIYFYEN